MYYILTALAFLVIGFVIGGLTFRNNVEKFKKTEDSGKKLLDALKGR
jgi:hypothetical protein